eukprot:6683042-Pyramimonas_sp.AAC.1
MSAWKRLIIHTLPLPPRPSPVHETGSARSGREKGKEKGDGEVKVTGGKKRGQEVQKGQAIYC